MMMTNGWMRVGMVGAMMVAATMAGAQTTAEDAAKAAEAQAIRALVEAQVQAQVAAIPAEVDAQVQMARLQTELKRMAPMHEKLQALSSAESQAQLARIQAQVARLGTEQAALHVDVLPEEARVEMMMAPLQAEMMARSAAMQARMMVRGLMLQDGMVAVGDPQVKDELFAGTEKFANGASDVTDVNLGPDMLGMVSGKHGGDLAHKLNFMVVKTYEYPRAGMYKMEDVDAYRQKLRAGNWNCFIHTHESSTGESTDICNRALPNGQGNEMVIMTVEPKELTFIHMSGTGSLADLGRLGRMGGYGGNIPTPPTPPTPPEPHQ